MIIFLLFCSASIAYAQWKNTDGNPDRGVDCNNNATIRWHFVGDRIQCYPYKYLGCGGYAGFESETECNQERTWRIDDFDLCPGFRNSSGHCTGRNRYGPYGRFRFGETEEPIVNCPDDHFCLDFPVGGGGMCCPKEGNDAVEADRNPECPEGSEAVRVGENNEVFAGLNCTHEFCPNDSTCHVGRHISYCCDKKK